jgi:hypothetical protein
MSDTTQDQKDNNKDRIIFQAVLTPDKKFRIEVKSSNLMGLSYAYKLLGLHIDNIIIKQTMPPPKIVKLGGGGLQSLGKFLDN